MTRRSGSAGGARGGSSVIVKVLVGYEAPGTLTDVQLTVSVPKPLAVDGPSSTFLLSTVSGKGHEPESVRIAIDPSGLSSEGAPPCLPSTNMVTITASYKTPSGEPRCQELKVKLPLSAFGALIGPTKKTGNAITIGTNRPPPVLTTIFEDLMMSASPSARSASGAAGNVLSFQYINGIEVSTCMLVCRHLDKN